MANMSYLAVLERYQEHRHSIDQLVSSIVTGIAERRVLDNGTVLKEAMEWLSNTYPFVDLIYTLDAKGVQVSENIAPDAKASRIVSGLGRNRSQRPYFIAAQQSEAVAITEPYLSSASHLLCVSAAQKITDESGTVLGFLVVDIDLGDVIEFLMGDRQRRRYQPWFKAVYGLIVLGLFAVVAVLLFIAANELFQLIFRSGHVDATLKPFSIIIFLTLALAVFDLGKTMIEEEVLMHKDIFRHSSTRRTITRFIAAILIAVSIESLLLMFKSVLGDAEHLRDAVAMMAAAIGLLIGLGIYVYLGAKAEYTLRAGSKR